jgi:hypothetical protein
MIGEAGLVGNFGVRELGGVRALVPYRLNSAQFAQDIFVIACNYLKVSLLCLENKNSSPERLLAPAPLA